MKRFFLLFSVLLIIYPFFFSCDSYRLNHNSKDIILAEENSNNELISELCVIYGLDQGIRNKELWKTLDKETIIKIDSLNFERFINIVRKFGYPNEKILGDKFEVYECVQLAGFAIMLHNPHKLIQDKTLFNLFLDEVNKGNLDSETFATILDKHYWFRSRGERVMYGSQFGAPCIDTKEETNRLRKEIGLEPLNDDEFKECD